MLAQIIWDPNRNFFVVPYINHPVTWYGFLFAMGFLLGYFLVRKIFSEFLAVPEKPIIETKLQAVQLTDRLAVLVILGTVIGARLGHVFFYGWPYFREHPLDIFKIWEGGLASHGGALGVLIALFIFVGLSKKTDPKLTFLSVLDALVVPAALVGGFIRIGNFLNQEITGIPTDVPWAVIFMRPLDGLAGVSVHPVQLYESLFYFFVFIVLIAIWLADKKTVGLGLLSGWFFVLVFGFRFFIEYLKVPQNEAFDLDGWIRMGQMLSIPFVLLGMTLLIRYYVRAKS